MAWVLRWKENCKLKDKNQRELKELSESELQKAETKLIIMDQKRNFEQDMKSLLTGKELKEKKLKFMNPFLDHEGVMRAKTRISFSDLVQYEAKFPIILAKESIILKLIIDAEHHKFQHCGGVNFLYVELLKRIWAPGLRQIIKTRNRECMKCRRARAETFKYKMAPIPIYRVQEPLGAFVKVGVDYAGPFRTIQGRGIIRKKRYICLFTCLLTRAIHLELAMDLETDSFLRCFQRFISRRGMPQLVISDNGTNFVGASNEIEEIHVNNQTVKLELSKNKIEWRFNPPASPHFGGIYESLIKSMKNALYKILPGADVTDEELLTVVIQVEGILNNVLY